MWNVEKMAVSIYYKVQLHLLLHLYLFYYYALLNYLNKQSEVHFENSIFEAVENSVTRHKDILKGNVNKINSAQSTKCVYTQLCES